jgi:aryl carrier-like protein
MKADHPVQAVLPLLPSQHGIYVESKDRPAQYVSQQRIEIDGPLDSRRLVAAWQETCRDHQALRTSIRELNGHLVQVVMAEPTAAAMLEFEISAADTAGQAPIAAEICAEELRRGFDLASGPLVRLALIRFNPGRALLCVTQHHIVLDGRSMQLVLDDVARRYDRASAPARAGPSLSDVMRALRLLGPAGAPAPVAAAHQMTTFPLATRPPVLAAVSASAEIGQLQALAAEHGLTPASLAIASWLMLLAQLRGAPDVTCAVSRDIRPAQLSHAELAIGMLAQTNLLGVTIPPASQLADVARQVQAAFTGARPFPPLADALRSMWQSGASGRPDTLLTVYSGGALPSPPAGLRWRLAEAQDTTEFAADVTVRLSGQVEIDLSFDINRIDLSVAEYLIQGMRDLLSCPQARPRAYGGRLPQHTDSSPQPGTATVPWRVIEAIATRVLGRRIARDENLITTGTDSLTLITLVSAFLAAGWEISIAELMEYGTLGSLLPRMRASARSDPGLAAASSWPPDPSPGEAGWLDRTEDRSLGFDPLHEQSVLGFHTKLDRGRFAAALLQVLDHLPSLDRCWVAGPHLLVYRGQAGPALDVVQLRDDLPVRDAVRQVVQSDAQRPFRPDGSALLRCTLMTGPDISVLLLSFHYSMLDGWSFGTFVRAVENAYATDATRITIGSDSGGYRAWSAAQPVSGQWTDALRGARPMPRIEPKPGKPARTSRPAAVPAELIRRAARRCGVTASVIMQAAAMEAACQILGQPRDAAVGLRMSLRSGTPQADKRTVGQLTADIPILPRQDGLSELALRVAQTIRLGYSSGHIGEPAFRALTGCAVDQLLMHTVIVTENYYQLDEAMVRRVDKAAWPEAFSWRRDVMAAPRAIYLQEGTKHWAIELSTVIDAEVDQLTASCATRIIELLRAAVTG